MRNVHNVKYLHFFTFLQILSYSLYLIEVSSFGRTDGHADRQTDLQSPLRCELKRHILYFTILYCWLLNSLLLRFYALSSYNYLLGRNILSAAEQTFA